MKRKEKPKKNINRRRKRLKPTEKVKYRNVLIEE